LFISKNRQMAVFCPSSDFKVLKSKVVEG